jgi:hypothetical protein
MRDRLLFRGIAGLLLAALLAFSGCANNTGGGDDPPPSTNPLLGAWRRGTAAHITSLLVFTEAVAYYAPTLHRQEQIVDKTNEFIWLTLPGENYPRSYLYELNANRQLVLRNSYFTDRDDNSIDFAFTRMEGSTKTGIEDVWYSRGREAEDPLYTLLVIRTDGRVYAAFGLAMSGFDWNFYRGDWIRASYELIGVTPSGGTIRWTDGSGDNNNYAIEGEYLSIFGTEYTKQNL